MFEPENDIERMLMRASTEPAARPEFLRALMDAEIQIVLVPDRPLAAGPDGTTTIPAGVKLSMPSATRGEEKLIPFFTARSRARAWFTGTHIVSPEKTRDLFTRFPDTSFFLNPRNQYGKEFVPGEVKRLLAGHFEDGPERQVIQKGEQILLGHPKETPFDLIAALKRELSVVPMVRGAWLMLAMRQGASAQSWMLGVDHDGVWQDVRDAIGRAVADDNVLGGWMLDAMPIDNSERSATLRGGIPIITAAPTRGPFPKLSR